MTGLLAATASADDGSDLHWTDLDGARRANRTTTRERQRLQLHALLLALDAAAIMLGFAIGNVLRYASPLGDHRAPSMAALVLPIYLVVALTNRSYSLRVLLDPRYGIARALTALATAAAAVVFLAFFLKASADFSRLAFAYGSLAAATALTLGRRLFPLAVRHLSPGALLARVVIVDGVPAPAIVGATMIDAAAANLVPDIADPHSLDRLGRFVAGADRVIVACRADRRQAWAMALKGAHVVGEIVDDHIAAMGAIGTRRYHDISTLIVATGALGLRSRVLKRLLDLSLAGVALVLLLPLLLVVAVAVKLEDRGPILFGQPRLGRGNRLFRMYKFRSMRADSCDEHGAASTRRDDDRITAVGRLIRRTSIDELPQLFNILRGEMSFVGPRPHALGSLAGDALFWEIDQRYWHRHNAKPGLTGLAQVRGFRGATLQRADLVNRLQADLEYIDGWTLGRDIMILLATVRVVVHRNAY